MAPNGFDYSVLWAGCADQARMDYMHAGSRLAVIPSLMENAPYTVLECLVAGIPFLRHDSFSRSVEHAN